LKEELGKKNYCGLDLLLKYQSSKNYSTVATKKVARVPQCSHGGETPQEKGQPKGNEAQLVSKTWEE